MTTTADSPQDGGMSREEIRDEIWDAMMNCQDIETSITDLADAALERLESLGLIVTPESTS